MDLKLSFTDKEVTPWSGTVLLKKMLDRMGFDVQLDKLPLPVQGSNRGYDPKQLIKQFMTSVWCEPINLNIVKSPVMMKF